MVVELGPAGRERRFFVLAGAGLLAAVALLAWLQTFSIDRTYREEEFPGLRVNVNTADAATLALLEQVGPERARRIVEYREAHGPYRALGDLLEVEGIGQKTLEQLAGRICFSGE